MYILSGYGGLFIWTPERGRWRQIAFDQTTIAQGYRMRVAVT